MPSPSTKLAAFFDVLRDTGTVLPFPNWQLAQFLQEALEQCDPSQFASLDIDEDEGRQLQMAEEVRDTLVADLEVVVDALQFAEENDDG